MTSDLDYLNMTIFECVCKVFQFSLQFKVNTSASKNETEIDF